MLRALYSSAAGMHSQQLNLDVISNNLANVNTTGFKKSRGIVGSCGWAGSKKCILMVI